MSPAIHLQRIQGATSAGDATTKQRPQQQQPNPQAQSNQHKFRKVLVHKLMHCERASALGFRLDSTQRVRQQRTGPKPQPTAPKLFRRHSHRRCMHSKRRMAMAHTCFNASQTQASVCCRLPGSSGTQRRTRMYAHTSSTQDKEAEDSACMSAGRPHRGDACR